MYFLGSLYPSWPVSSKTKLKDGLCAFEVLKLRTLKRKEEKKQFFCWQFQLWKYLHAKFNHLFSPYDELFFCIMYSLTELNTNLAPGFEKPGPRSRPQNGWSPHLEQSLTKKILNVYHNCLISHMISSIFVFGWALVHHMGTGAHCPKNNPSLHA